MEGSGQDVLNNEHVRKAYLCPLFLALSFFILILSPPGLDEGRAHYPEDNGHDRPDNGVKQDIIFQVLNDGVKYAHGEVFAFRESALSAKELGYILIAGGERAGFPRVSAGIE